MNKASILIIIFIFFCSCNEFINYKEVEIIINEKHPFEEISNKDLWYNISYTDGFGQIKNCHLVKNKKKLKLLVRKGQPIFICAKALDKYSPIGGVILADEKRVVLKYEEGKMVEFLQNLYIQNSEAVSSINYNLLLDVSKKKGLLESFNELILARDIICGNLCEASLYKNDKISVSIEQAIEGYWVSENPDEGCFFISDSDYYRVKLSLSTGKYFYINIEKGYQMVIIVDSKSRKYFIKIERVPFELL